MCILFAFEVVAPVDLWKPLYLPYRQLDLSFTYYLSYLFFSYFYIVSLFYVFLSFMVKHSVISDLESWYINT